MTDERLDLAAAEAVALSPEESENLLAELEHDPALASTLDEYRSTVSMLESSVARERPSHDLFAGVLAEIKPEREPEPAPVAARERSWSWRRALPRLRSGPWPLPPSSRSRSHSIRAGSEPDAVAAVQGTPEFSGVHGEARIYDSGSANGVLRLDLADVPAAPDGEHYEVLGAARGRGGAMEAVGVFDRRIRRELELGLPGTGDDVAVDISVEPDAAPRALWHEPRGRKVRAEDDVASRGYNRASPGYSSAGRAPGSHPGGRRFEPG